jgi:bifunctional enzyme CysN/CysC
VAFDTHNQIVATGRFVIVDGFEVAGGGIIIDDAYPRRASDPSLKGDNLYWSHGKVTAEQRYRRNGHPGCVLWFTGLSGSGKSTIANELERELFNLGKQAYVLDGDNIRQGLSSDLTFSPQDRMENIRRVGEVAKLFADAGLIVVTAFISPYRSDRDMIRQLMPPGRFIEVFVNAPLDICEQRDPKGLYVKARAKEIREFTGVSAPYEAPEKPDLELRTDLQSVEQSISQILEYLHIHDEDRTVSI